MRSARIFNCARCHIQVAICSHCDRGNIYCGSACAKQAAVQNHRRANAIYQQSLKGRLKHAKRQQRYRQRQKEKSKKVTDVGSTDLSTNDLLLKKPKEDKQINSICCHFCGAEVSPLLRNGFLRHFRGSQQRYSSSWPLGP